MGLCIDDLRLFLTDITHPPQETSLELTLDIVVDIVLHEVVELVGVDFSVVELFRRTDVVLLHNGTGFRVLFSCAIPAPPIGPALSLRRR